MLQANEAALKADLASMRDDQSNGMQPAAEAAGEMGAKKEKKAWGDRMKEVKERAEKARANLIKKPA